MGYEYDLALAQPLPPTQDRLLQELQAAAAAASDMGTALLPLLREGLTPLHLHHLTRRFGADFQAPLRPPSAASMQSVSTTMGMVGACCRLPQSSTGLRAAGAVSWLRSSEPHEPKIFNRAVP